MAFLDVDDEKKGSLHVPSSNAIYSATVLPTRKFPDEFHSTFNAVPTYKPQNYGTEAICDGQTDRRTPYVTETVEDFCSRIGQLNVTFDGLTNAQGKDLSFKGTATVFYADSMSHRAYAITCAHNVMHYNHVTERTHLMKNIWFDRRVTCMLLSVPYSKSQTVYEVDQVWVHPQYIAKRIIDPNDVAIVSFKIEDGFCCPTPNKLFDFASLSHILSKPGWNSAAAPLLQERFSNVMNSFNPRAWLNMAKCCVFQRFKGLCVIGYPGEKRGQLWGEIVYEKRLHQVCSPERNGQMLSYTIHTSGGQSGSSIVEGDGEKLTIVGIHTSTNSEDKNYGVVLDSKTEWILKSVLSNYNHKHHHNAKKNEILQFFQ